MADPWDLVKSKQYSAAVNEYSRLIEDAPTQKPPLFNRGTAYLLLGEYNAALGDFQRIISLGDWDTRGDSEYIHAGICCWYLDRPGQAVEYWKGGLGAPYTDSAGGVQLPALLLYAGTRLQDSILEQTAIKLLNEHWKKHTSGAGHGEVDTLPSDSWVRLGQFFWPGPIVPFLLGHVDSTRLLKSAQDPSSDILRTRQQCAADFYLGLRALRQDNWPEFQTRMQSCASSTHGELEHEYYLARWEVARDFPKPTVAKSISGT